MKINEHTLVHAKDAGNGYHGNCKHCGLALVTDLGYCSWDNTVCIDREVKGYEAITDQIRSFAEFRGLVFDHGKDVFIKPYSNEVFTVDELNTIIQAIT